MKLGSQLTIKQSQNLAMTQSLQQAIRILQLNQLELDLEISQQLDSNIMLEAETDNDIQSEYDNVDDEIPESSLSGSDEYEGMEVLDFEQAENIEVDLDWDPLDDYDRVSNMLPDDDLDPLNQLSEVHHETLNDLLLWQLEMIKFSPQDRRIAEFIIDSITPDGYFFIALADVTVWVQKEYPEVEEDDVAVVLKHIQQFDPPGVAATSLEGCLIKQIESRKSQFTSADKTIEILKMGADLLARLDFKGLQRKFGLQEDELRLILSELKSLNPKPGSMVGSNSITLIKPDILVNIEKGQITVSLNSEVLPKLRINRKYARLAQLAKKEERGVLREHLTNARFFIKHIEDRFDTLLKVARAIVNHQKLFFLYGARAMRSLQLKNIAEELGYNESTISRAISGKFLLCPTGMYELKFFFSNEVDSAKDGDDSASSVAIRAALKEIIDSENPEKPYSDAKLVALLEQKGFKIARRTVAKYRDVLGVLSSSERKRLA